MALVVGRLEIGYWGKFYFLRLTPLASTSFFGHDYDWRPLAPFVFAHYFLEIRKKGDLVKILCNRLRRSD